MGDPINNEIALKEMNACLEELNNLKRYLNENKDEIRKCFWDEPAQNCYKGLDAINTITDQMRMRIEERKTKITVEMMSGNMLL